MRWTTLWFVGAAVLMSGCFHHEYGRGYGPVYSGYAYGEPFVGGSGYGAHRHGPHCGHDRPCDGHGCAKYEGRRGRPRDHDGHARRPRYDRERPDDRNGRRSRPRDHGGHARRPPNERQQPGGRDRRAERPRRDSEKPRAQRPRSDRGKSRQGAARLHRLGAPDRPKGSSPRVERRRSRSGSAGRVSVPLRSGGRGTRRGKTVGLK